MGVTFAVFHWFGRRLCAREAQNIWPRQVAVFGRFIKRSGFLILSGPADFPFFRFIIRFAIPSSDISMSSPFKWPGVTYLMALVILFLEKVVKKLSAFLGVLSTFVFVVRKTNERGILVIDFFQMLERVMIMIMKIKMNTTMPMVYHRPSGIVIVVLVLIVIDSMTMSMTLTTINPMIVITKGFNNYFYQCPVII